MAARRWRTCSWRWWLQFGLWSCCFWSLILGQETVVETPENSAVNLPCKAYALQSNIQRIEWKFQRDKTTVLFYHNSQLTDSYKDRAVFHPNEMHFNSVTRKDNGVYTCEVLGNGFSQSQVKLVVQVPPSKPKAEVPSVVTIGTKAILRCLETDGSPPPTFRWFKDNIPVPEDPKTSSKFRNSSYTFDPKTGVLAFEPTTAVDAGDYYCEAANNVGTPQKSDTVRMETSEVNVGAIVAAVVVLLIVLGLVIFGIWFAYSRGFFSKRTNTTNKKVIYSQPSARSDGEFKQTSSFLV